MKTEQWFELKLSDGQTARWLGTSGENAAQRYADAHPGVVVVAWRYPQFEFRPGMIQIVD